MGAALNGEVLVCWQAAPISTAFDSAALDLTDGGTEEQTGELEPPCFWFTLCKFSLRH